MAAEKFSLSWNDFGDNVINTFQSLLTDEHFTDVTIVSGDGKQIKAHKVVLSSCSQFFNQILLENPHNHPLLFLKGITHSELQAIMKFMYLCQTDVAQDDLRHFMEASAELQIKGLQEKPESESKDLNLEIDADHNSQTENSQNTVKGIYEIDIINNDAVDESSL